MHNDNRVEYNIDKKNNYKHYKIIGGEVIDIR